MTPEEKAQEIINSIRKVIQKAPMAISYENERQIAIRSAIICVEEIVKAIDFDWMEVQNLDREHKYWEEVKKEIEKL